MVRILHLFPNLMNLYGDYANITVLKKHLEDQGEQVIVDRKDIEDNIYFDKYDFVYMGSGTESNLVVALEKIMKYKDDIVKYVESRKTLLFTGNASELFGKTIDGVEALNIFNFSTIHTNKRFTGDVIVKDKKKNFVVGFINRSSNIIRGDDSNYLFEYVMMDKGLNDNDEEGFVLNNAFVTHIIGPILVKNPDFMNRIIKAILPSVYEYKNIRYEDEVESYLVTLEALKDRI